MQVILLKEELEDLYLKKELTDKVISEIFNCGEHTIRNLRKEFKIDTFDRYQKRNSYLKSLSDDQLKKIVLNNNYKGIQKILGLSSFFWKKELEERGIELKSKIRLSQYPELTEGQTRLIIGGLLGDGGINSGGKNCARYFESHSPKQYLYLKRKHTILKPFSSNIYIDKAYGDLFCYRFSTISHPHFKKFRDLFYQPSLKGKLIPLEYIKSLWHDDILAYWFLDDGHFDEKSGCYTIANKCPKPEQLYAFLAFLSEYYQAPFTLYNDPDLFSIKIPLKFKERFIRIILNVATEDMLYKVPPIYRLRRKDAVAPELKYGEFAGSPQIIDIREKISIGYTFENLKEEYPITENLFKKLGGTTSKYITINHPLVHEIIGDGRIPDIRGPLDKDVVIGTLLGDGNVYKYGEGNGTCVFSFAHSLPQAGYIKLKYELLKSYVNRIRFLKNSTNNFYSFHVILKSLSVFSDYYNLFYTAKVASKRHPQKDLFKEDIVNLINPRVFAFWAMDDGKKYGSGKYMFSITIGKQPYYSFREFQRIVGLLNDKLGFNLNAREEKISYEITTMPGKAEEVYHKIKEHMWPYFSYKLGVARSELGQQYKGFSWFSEWEDVDACL